MTCSFWGCSSLPRYHSKIANGWVKIVIANKYGIKLHHFSYFYSLQAHSRPTRHVLLESMKIFTKIWNKYENEANSQHVLTYGKLKVRLPLNSSIMNPIELIKSINPLGDPKKNGTAKITFYLSLSFFLIASFIFIVILIKESKLEIAHAISAFTQLTIISVVISLCLSAIVNHFTYKTDEEIRRERDLKVKKQEERQNEINAAKNIEYLTSANSKSSIEEINIVLNFIVAGETSLKFHDKAGPNFKKAVFSLEQIGILEKNPFGYTGYLNINRFFWDYLISEDRQQKITIQLKAKKQWLEM